MNSKRNSSEHNVKRNDPIIIAAVIGAIGIVAAAFLKGALSRVPPAWGIFLSIIAAIVALVMIYMVWKEVLLLPPIKPNRAFLILLIFSILATFGFKFLGFFEPLEQWTLNMRALFKISSPLDEKIKVILIDNKTCSRLNQRSPLSRRNHADLLNRLGGYPSQVIFDIYYSGQESDDERFSKSITDAGNFYFPLEFISPLSFGREDIERIEVKTPVDQVLKERFAYPFLIKNSRINLGKYKELSQPPPPIDFLKEAKGVGHGSFIPEGNIMKVPLIVKYNNRLYPCLGLVSASDYLNIPRNEIRISKSRLILKEDELEIPLDKDGAMLINFVSKRELEAESFIDVYNSNDEELREKYKGKIVLIGAEDHIYPTPFSPNYPTVGIHAHVIDNILNQRYLMRKEGWNFIIIMLMGLIGGMLTWINIPWGIKLISLIFISGGYVYISMCLFLSHIWIDLTYPEFIFVPLIIYISARWFLEKGKATSELA